MPCPAGIDDLAAKLVWAGEREAIVPGVSYVGKGRADVMRGEEVQLLGARRRGPGRSERDWSAIPGTHNKWALLRQRQDPDASSTVMTGELFNLLKEHSILADLLQGAGRAERRVPRRRPPRDLQRELLPAELFSVRARVLLGQAKKEDAASYASGLLIGDRRADRA